MTGRNGDELELPQAEMTWCKPLLLNGLRVLACGFRPTPTAVLRLYKQLRVDKNRCSFGPSPERRTIDGSAMTPALAALKT